MTGNLFNLNMEMCVLTATLFNTIFQFCSKK